MALSQSRAGSGAALRLSTAEVPAIDDASLVERALAGDSWSEEVLVRRHMAELTRVVGRLLGSRTETEDVVQDSLVRALEELPRLRDPASFKSWLIRIGVNQARGLLRRRRLGSLLGIHPGPRELSLEHLAVSSLSPESRAELALLDKALARVPIQERIAWTLRTVEGYPLAETAQACGCSLATAKRRITAAHQKLQKIVNLGEVGDE